MSRPLIVLVKPPEVSEIDFGAFSLGVLAAFIREVAEPVIVDATDWPPAEAVERVWSLKPDMVGVTVMGLGSLDSALKFLRLLSCGGDLALPRSWLVDTEQQRPPPIF